MVTSKYEKLADYLTGRKEEMLRMTFEQIENLIDGPLPQAAYEHRAWWANSDSNNHAINGWMQAGWETTRVDMDNKELMFVRRAPYRQYQFALPSQPKYRDRGGRYSQGDSVSSELEDILQRTNGVVNLSRIVQAVEDYIHGDLEEIELGQKLRKFWPRR
jgi:hypothetical protein